MSIKRSWVPFYAWWVQVSLLAVGVYWAASQGVLKLIYEADVSHITQVIAVLLAVGIARIGWMAYKFGKTTMEYNMYPRMRKHVEEWNEATTMFMQLGLVGTIVGFATLSYEKLGNIDFSQPVDMMTILPGLLGSLGTVFFAAGVGVSSAIILGLHTRLFTSFTGLKDSDYNEG